MIFAFLGDDRELLPLARGLLARGEHEIAWFIAAGDLAASLADAAPAARHSSEWESLLTGDNADVVIVGRSQSNPDARADQLRKLVQAKIPLVLLHPACESIIGYELEMIRRDVGGVIVPHFPGLRYPALRDLKQAELGRWQQVVCERGEKLATRAEAAAQLARDAEFIRQLIGPCVRVGAMGQWDDARGPLTLSVQITGAEDRLGRWSLEPWQDQSGGKLTLVGSVGQATLYMPNDAAWRLTLPAPGTTFERTYDDADEAAALVAELQRVLAAQQSPDPTWIDVCRATEIADCVPRCIARGKTVDLFNEEHTEESTFKGVMAVGGCLILLLGLLLVIVVSVVEGIGLPLWQFDVWSRWPAYLLALFFFFLLLQLFKLAAKK